MEQDVDALVTKLGGECCLTVSRDEVNRAGSKLRWALIMKVMMDKKVKEKLLWDTLRSVWVLAGKVSFAKLSDKVFVANFQLKEDQEKILEGGPWTYLGRVILMKRWEPGIAPDNFRHNTIQMWVQLHNLPMEARDPDIAVKLARIAGKVVPKVKTKRQLEEEERSSYLRFRIDFDLQNSVKAGAYYNAEGAISGLDPVSI
ncbi:unnamed protein product [Rhodiola kirilowii]